MFRTLAPAILAALLAACASTPPVEEVATPEQPTPEEKAEPAERHFPDESLYPLLVAEFALRRQAYDVALDNYLEQAPRLRDPGVSAHTTHLAQFMQRETEALEAVQLWVQLEPGSVEANNTLATLLVRQGRNIEAVPHLAVVARHAKQANFPMLLSDFADMAPDKQARLQAAIEELALEFPDDPALLLTRALVLAETEQFDRALELLDVLFEEEPFQQQALLLEARILLRQGARDPFRRVELALAADPEDTRLRLQYGRLLTSTDMAAAREQFEILSAQSPRDDDLLMSLALINREIGDDARAETYLRQLLELGQRQDEAHYFLGRIAEDAGDVETAASHYMRVGESREFASASNRLGRILISAGEIEESREWFARQRERYPRQREQLYGIEAELLREAGALEASMAVLNAALSEMPESASLRYARSMLGEQQNDLALMERDLRAIIARDPDNATALNALGYSLANRTDRYGEAYQLISRALALSPDEPAILDSMGWVLYRKGRYEEALDYLTRAYAAFPDPEVAAHLGEVLWVSGKTGAASTVWQGALRKDPDHEVLVSTLKRLGVTSLNGEPLEFGD
ncbi:MAG: tetratricopeptide repeat protein [Halioglobus sp.]